MMAKVSALIVMVVMFVMIVVDVAANMARPKGLGTSAMVAQGAERVTGNVTKDAGKNCIALDVNPVINLAWQPPLRAACRLVRISWCRLGRR